MAIQIKRAVKYESKLRMAIAGPSGSGKTYTALSIASGLAGDKGVIVIDTERGSASKYADIFPAFDVIELELFSPENYIEAIHAAEQNGYGVLVIDSISHEWTGPGGMLEIVDAITKRKQSGNSFTSWGEATPRHNRLIDAITRANLHVIVTMRSKQEYTLERDERTGKTSPRKVGMAPIQRDGFEYETDIYCDMDIDNTLIVQKSRCPALAGAVIAKPNAKVAETLKVWLSGEAVPIISAVVPSNGHQPTQPAAQPLLNGDGSPAFPEKHSLMEVKEFFLKYFRESQWRGFKNAEVGPVEDEGLADSELAKLWMRLVVIDEDQKARAGAQVSAAN